MAETAKMVNKARVVGCQLKLTPDKHLALSPNRAPRLDFIAIYNSLSVPVHLWDRPVPSLLPRNFGVKDV